MTFRVLPLVETGCTEEVPTWLYLDVFVILCTDLAQLKGGAHLTIELILLLCHLDVVLLGLLHQVTKVRVDTATIRVQEKSFPLAI